MRVSPSEVLQLAVRAEHARQPNLARELYTLAGRMDREPGTDGLEPSGTPALDHVFVLWDGSHSPACKSCVEGTHARSAAWARGFMMAVRIGLFPEMVAVAEAAGRVS